jgi:hypothetical protein
MVAESDEGHGETHYYRLKRDVIAENNCGMITQMHALRELVVRQYSRVMNSREPTA